MTYRIIARKADGRGDLDFGHDIQSEDLACQIRDGAFSADHGVTMCWVLDDQGHMVGEPLFRWPPGMDEA